MATSVNSQQLTEAVCNSPGNRAYWYTELAVSSLMVAVTIASTDYTYQRTDGQAE